MVIKRTPAWSTIFSETPTYNDLVFSAARLRSHIELISISETTKSLNVDNKDGGWNPIFESLIRLYQKLKDVGFIY